MFWVINETDFAGYANNNTNYFSRDSLTNVIKSFEDGLIILFKWFLEKQIKTNSNKCHLITNKKSCMNLDVGNINIEKSSYKK